MPSVRKILPLSAQVSGVITELSPNLEPGALPSRGTGIDSRDYRLAVAQEAARSNKQLDFRLARERQTAAQRNGTGGNTGEAPELAAQTPTRPRGGFGKCKAGQARAGWTCLGPY